MDPIPTITPAPELPPLITHIINFLLLNNFCTEDEEYAPENVREDASFYTQFPDLIFWHQEDRLHWSFFTFYIYASGDQSAALIEMGVGTDFDSEAAYVAMELTRDPSNEAEVLMHVGARLASEHEWDQFVASNLNPAYERATKIAEEMVSVWSEDETDVGSQA